METLRRCMSGRHTPAEIRWHLAFLAVGYWSLVLCAWLGYPDEHKYSIFQDTLSTLGSYDLRKNPEWFWLFSVAMVFCGLTMMPIILYIRRRLTAVSAPGARVGTSFFLMGCAAIALTGIFPDANGRIVGKWDSGDIHGVTAVTIAVTFSFGMIWCGFLLLRDRLTKRTFANWGKNPYRKLVGPFCLCLPIFVATGYKIRWGSVYAALTALAGASKREILHHLDTAFRGLQSFPLLEHIAIWALTLFVIWFAVALPAEEPSLDAE